MQASGFIALIAAIIVSRFVSERAYRELDSDQKLRLMDGFSSTRMYSMVPLFALVPALWYLMTRTEINKSLITAAYSGLLIVYVVVRTILTLVIAVVFAGAAPAAGAEPRDFDQARDLLSLHYDHAPDKDDGHSAAADRTLLESLFGREWIRRRVVAVSGAYGKNAKSFNPKSDAVMDAAWNDCEGWLAGHTRREQVVVDLSERWSVVLENGGDVWVKEGGQSDITADVVKRIRLQTPGLNTTRRIHVVQHSNWNENQTTDAALAYTKTHTDYIRIKDANRFLNIKGGNKEFEEAAKQHPVFGAAWEAAFTYYNPRHRLDFSDTGELMRILGLGEISIDDFRRRFFAKPQEGTPNRTNADDGN